MVVHYSATFIRI